MRTHKELKRFVFMLKSRGDIDSISKKMLLDLIEKEEKNRWHDLGVDSNDLPKKDGEYYCYARYPMQFSPDPDNWDMVTGYVIDCFQNGRWTFGEEILGWREIDPFNSGEQI